MDWPAARESFAAKIDSLRPIGQSCPPNSGASGAERWARRGMEGRALSRPGNNLDGTEAVPPTPRVITNHSGVAAWMCGGARENKNRGRAQRGGYSSEVSK